MNSPVVVLGASGFVGGHLLERLAAMQVQVRAGSRSPARAREHRPEATWVHADVTDRASLTAAFAGADAVVYLVHHMRSDEHGLVEAEAEGARNVLAAAEQAGVRRIVYLGGPAPASGTPSEHLAARLRTGEVLRSGTVSTVELRAGMVIGAGSESWLIVRDLAMRLPVMVVPRWLNSRSQPIGTRDVVRALVAALELDEGGSCWFNIPGPEEISGRDILIRVAAAAGMRPLMLGVPVLTPSLSSHWIRLVSRADYTIARKLVDGLTCDLVAEGPSFWEATGEAPDPLDVSIRRALDEEDLATMGRTGRWLERLTRRLARQTTRVAV